MIRDDKWWWMIMEELHIIMDRIMDYIIKMYYS